jgi:hypothetical protein
VPFRVFGPRCSPQDVAARRRPLKRWLLVQSTEPVNASRSLVPRDHLAVSRFLGCVVLNRRAALATLSNQCTLSSSFARLQSVAQHVLACRSNRQAPLVGFRSLQHTQARRSTGCGRLPCIRYGPPSGFGYPLGGLRPPSPGRFCFTPAALMGFALRSFLLSEGIHPVSGAERPTYRLTRRCSRRRKAMGRPNRPRFLGFDPFESPSQQAGV